MPRYINATLLKAEFTGDFIDTSYSPEFIKAIIDKQSTADVQEVRRGKWKVCGWFDFAECSCCGYKEPSYYVFTMVSSFVRCAV